MLMRSGRRLVVCGLFISSVAGACPSTWSSFTCDGGGGTSVCQVLNETTWVCDLTVNGDAVAGTVTLIGGYSTYDFVAWGTDASGASFCCTETDVDLERVAVSGGSFEDTITFTTTIAGAEYNLENVSGASSLVGFADGRAGSDLLYGSDADSDDYRDSLHGGDGSDTIRGYGGDDEVTGDGGDDLFYGGNGDDTLYGDDGADTFYGEGGADTLIGGAGADVMIGGGDADFIVGGAGADRVSGSAGNDIIHGDEGADVLCGGADDDSLFGGGERDQLWGDNGTDMAHGTAGWDSCDADTVASCETTLSSKPSRCP